jgi:hypothetical protein
MAVQYEDKTEAFTLFTLSFEGSLEGRIERSLERRYGHQVGAPPSRFEGGSWGSLRPEPASRRSRTGVERARNRSAANSSACPAADEIHNEYRTENAPFLIATRIIRNRPNSSEFSDLNFSNRNKNSYFARAFARHLAKIHQTREAENAPSLIDSTRQLRIPAIPTKQRPGHVSNR